MDNQYEIVKILADTDISDADARAQIAALLLPKWPVNDNGETIVRVHTSGKLDFFFRDGKIIGPLPFSNLPVHGIEAISHEDGEVLEKFDDEHADHFESVLKETRFDVQS